MRQLGLLLMVAVLLAGGGFWYWTSTPQYAVQQAAKAIKEHDVLAFHNWVDVQSLSSSAVDDLVSEPVKKIGGVGLLKRIVGFGLVSFFKPAVVQSVGNQIDELVKRTGTTNPQEATPVQPTKSLLGQIIELVKPPSLTQTLREYGFTKANYRGLGELKTTDQMSLLPLKFFSPKVNHEVEVQLQLSKPAEHWQIVKITNLPEIVRSIIAD